MSTLPVSDEKFWKDRIDFARKNGKFHFSVYLARQTLWDDIYTKHVEILSKETKPTDRVLDAGCGYGRMSPLWGNYTGVDLSPDLLEEARKLYPSKNFMLGNLKSLPFKDKEFDVSFCISIKQMIVGNLGEPEWKLMEKELLRVSKKLILLEYENAHEYTVLDK